MSIAIRPSKQRTFSQPFPTAKILSTVPVVLSAPRGRILCAEAPDRGDSRREAPDAGETRRGGSSSESDFTHGRSWS